MMPAGSQCIPPRSRVRPAKVARIHGTNTTSAMNS